MEATVFLEAFGAGDIFCSLPPDLCLDTILSELCRQAIQPHCFTLTCIVNWSTLKLCAFPNLVQTISPRKSIFQWNSKFPLLFGVLAVGGGGGGSKQLIYNVEEVKLSFWMQWVTLFQLNTWMTSHLIFPQVAFAPVCYLAAAGRSHELLLAWW